MNYFAERITFLIVLIVSITVTQSLRTSRQINSPNNLPEINSDGGSHHHHNRPEDGGQLPNPKPPNFPDQNQGPRPSGTVNENVPNEGSIIFKPPCNCPTVGNYNPVCGSNNKTYANPSILNCHAKCGVAVEQVKLGSCGSNRG